MGLETRIASAVLSRDVLVSGPGSLTGSQQPRLANISFPQLVDESDFLFLIDVARDLAQRRRCC